MKLSKEIKIGIYVVVTLALLYWTVNFLKGRNIFGGEKTYYTVTQTVQGLRDAGPVYMRGLKIGRIDKIIFAEDKGYFYIRMKINSKYTVPTDSKAVIYSSDIMGTKSIKIELGKSHDMLSDGGALISEIESDLANIIVSNISTIRDKSDTLLMRLNTTFKRINQVLDEKTVAEIKSSIANISEITSNFAKSSKNINNILFDGPDNISKILKNIDSITNSIKSNAGNIDKTLENISGFSQKINEINISELSASVNSLVMAINNREGSMGKLIYNDSLYNQITESAKNLQLLLEDIKAHPRRYINVSVFGRKAK